MALKNNRRMYRNYTFILYPQESVDDYKQVLKETMIPLLLSPLHQPEDKDGNEKKVHHHVLLNYSGKKAVDQVSVLIEELRSKGLAVTRAEPVSDKLSLENYFIHKGWDEKEQFEWKDLIPLNGYVLKNPDEDKDYTIEILTWCNSAGCYQFNQIMDYAIAFYPEWVQTLTRKCFAICKYCECARLQIMESKGRFSE